MKWLGVFGVLWVGFAKACNRDLFCNNTVGAFSSCASHTSCTPDCQRALCARRDSECSVERCGGISEYRLTNFREEAYFKCRLSGCPSACNSTLLCANFLMTACVQPPCTEACRVQLNNLYSSGCLGTIVTCGNDALNISTALVDSTRTASQCGDAQVSTPTPSPSSLASNPASLPSVSPTPSSPPSPSLSSTPSPSSSPHSIISCAAPIVASCSQMNSAQCGCCGRGSQRGSTCLCALPFSGPYCEQTCNNRGAYNTTTNRCRCSSGHFTGRFCQVECSGAGSFDAASSRCSCHDLYQPSTDGTECIPCSGHGRIALGSQGRPPSCVCSGVYSGRVCEVECGGQGSVSGLGQCVCSNMTRGGIDCSFPCSGHGALVSGVCRCNAGWSGVGCNVECSGHGRLDSAGVCACVSPIFSGSSCESVCNGNGFADTDDTCVCNEGYSWVSTEHRCVTLQCQGAHRVISATGSCVCSPAYSGPNCDIPCNNHGTLRNGRCECSGTWTGPGCEVQCSGHGADTSGTCVCNPNFMGSRCEVECSGHGQVRDGRCSCTSPHTGITCNEVCSSRGVFEQGRCLCSESFYSGQMCQLECSGHGRVVNNVCVCDQFFGGTTCHSQCSRNGVVQRQSNSSRCACSSPLLSGDMCNFQCSKHGHIIEESSGETEVRQFVDYISFQARHSFDPTLRLKCECDTGYGGGDCSKQCSGNGVFTHSQCQCHSGFSGPACEIECSGQGHVVNGRCVCQNGAIGDLCQTPCSGNGFFAHGRCHCNGGYEGNCEPRCRHLCVNGRCQGEQCMCLSEGWGGRYCHATNCFVDGEVRRCSGSMLERRGCISEHRMSRANIVTRADYSPVSIHDNHLLQQVCAAYQCPCFGMVNNTCVCLPACLCQPGGCASYRSDTCPTNTTAGIIEIFFNQGFSITRNEIESYLGSHFEYNSSTPTDSNPASRPLLAKGTPLWYVAVMLASCAVLGGFYVLCYKPWLTKVWPLAGRDTRSLLTGERS